MKTKETITQMINEICTCFYLINDYTETDETIKAKEKVYSLYRNDNRFDNIRNDLEDTISQYGFKAEDQGFTYGFKTAIEIFNYLISAISDLDIISLLNKENFAESISVYFNLFIISYGHALKEVKKALWYSKVSEGFASVKKW